MGADMSVVLVSNEGQEFSIPMDVLSAASPVWRERLIINGAITKAPRSEETCTCDEIQAFIEIISLMSQDTKTSPSSLSITILRRALPLIHKYDCKGAQVMLDDLEERHFPSAGIVKLKQNVMNEAPLGGSATTIIARATDRKFLTTEEWVTQEHFDYIVLKQELYDHEALTFEMKMLLAVAMAHDSSKNGIMCRNGMSTYGKMLVGTVDRPTADLYLLEVEEEEDDDKGDVGSLASRPAPLLKLQAWRLEKQTIMSLFMFLKAAHEIK